MSSSRRTDGTRRDLLRRGSPLAFVILGACTIRPLAHAIKDDGLNEELAATQIVGLDDRLGQLVRNALLEEMNPSGLNVPSRYLLQIELQRSAQSLAIQLDNVITRFNLTLTADFELFDSKSGELLYESQVRRIASYNVSRQPFGTLSAEIDAEKRVAKEVGNNIRTLLAVHFARDAAST